MNKDTKAKVYEPPQIQKVGTFSRLTLGSPRWNGADRYGWRKGAE
ncbi:lasso RiPP family leader peptide-containing protein [Knoellia sp. CPCC 206453]